MKNSYSFFPPHRSGLIFHAVLFFCFASASALGFWQVFRVEIGPAFFAYLLLTLFSAGMLPLLAYRAYALRGAYYTLERDGIHLHWGLRTETIPMNTVLWIRLAKYPQQPDYKSLPMPLLHWPGAILGTRRISNTAQVEYMAAGTDGLILIATPQKVYAVSPANPDEFLFIYHRFSELGSLTPFPARSIYPAFLVAQIWDNRPARYLLFCGLIFNVILLGWVSLIIPSRPQIILNLIEEDLLPSTRLLLLPMMNTFFFLADVLLGSFFYRRSALPLPPASSSLEAPLIPRGRKIGSPGNMLSFLLWGSSILTSMFFLIAVYFIQVYG